jgi:hypothetical protein
MAAAVTRWSPVIIFTWMPAAWQVADRLPRLGARRIDDADQRMQGEIAHPGLQVAAGSKASAG